MTLAEQLFLDALGNPQTGNTEFSATQRRDISAILEMLTRAGYLVDDPSNIPALAPLAFIWARLPRTPTASHEMLTLEMFQQMVEQFSATTARHAEAVANDVESRYDELMEAITALSPAGAIPVAGPDSSQIASAIADQLVASILSAVKTHLHGMGLITAASVLLLAFLLGVWLEPELARLNHAIMDTSAPAVHGTVNVPLAR